MDTDRVSESKELEKSLSKENEKVERQYKVFKIGSLNFIIGAKASQRFVYIGFTNIAPKNEEAKSSKKAALTLPWELRRLWFIDLISKNRFSLAGGKSYLYISFSQNSPIPNILILLTLPLLILFLISRFFPSVASLISQPLITISFTNLLLSLILWSISYGKRKKNTAIKLTKKLREKISSAEVLFFDEIETESEMLLNHQPGGN